MALIKFEIEGDVQLSRNLRLAVSNLSNMKSFHEEAIGIMGKRSDSIFDNSGTTVEKSSKWKPLAESTKKARSNRRGYYKRPPSNPKTLRWTGKLQDSKKEQSNDIFGSLEFTAPYAKYHQNGGRNLPKRAIIDLSNKTNADIVRALQKKVNKDLGNFGLQI